MTGDWRNGAAWPGNAPTGQDWRSGAAWPTPESGPTDMTQGLTAVERRQFHIMRTRALTLGGNSVNAAVAHSATTLAVAFTRTEKDTSYGVSVAPSWGTTIAIGSKATSGFTITFGTAAPSTGSPTVDILTFRAES